MLMQLAIVSHPLTAVGNFRTLASHKSVFRVPEHESSRRQTHSPMRILRLRGGKMEDTMLEEGESSSDLSITETDRASKSRADYVARCNNQGLNISTALWAAVSDNKTSATIFVTKGTHNLTYDGDIEPQMETHMVGQEGSIIWGCAEPIKMKGMKFPFPESGGGRMRMEACATGSTFTGLRSACVCLCFVFVCMSVCLMCHACIHM
jgi:hypothetical protein